MSSFRSRELLGWSLCSTSPTAVPQAVPARKQESLHGSRAPSAPPGTPGLWTAAPSLPLLFFASAAKPFPCPGSDPTSFSLLSSVHFGGQPSPGQALSHFLTWSPPASRSTWFRPVCCASRCPKPSSYKFETRELNPRSPSAGHSQSSKTALCQREPLHPRL